MAQDITVARAAQAIHMSKEKIKIGSNIIFITADADITIIDILACHTDLIILLLPILKDKNTIPASNIEKYLTDNQSISGVAPKKISNGLINNIHSTANISEINIFMDWNVPKVLDT